MGNQEPESQLTKEVLQVINRLLTIPLGEQLYQKELSILFKILEHQTTPVFVTNGLPYAKT